MYRMPVDWRTAAVVIASAALLASCIEDNAEPAGLRDAEPSGGPRIVFDLDHWPFPEIPFPNDLATRPDPASPTGQRINVSLLGATEAEGEVRRYVNRLPGFGVYSPLHVRFDGPLDVVNISRRHREDVLANIDDDAVFLVNVDPDSDEYGQLELLDMGRGNFPLTLDSPNGYFENDPRAEGTNLIFETVGESDLDGNGQLDPLEDTDDDGVWDVPNLLDPGADPYAPGQLLEFYERESNTLVMRPVDVLEPATTYAVVLTSALSGADGRPIESPFPYINHTRQTPDLEALRDILPARLPERFTKDLEDVRFAWTFTTGTPTRELEAIRAGLYGHGSLSWLSGRFPAEFKLLHDPEGPEAEGPMTFKLDRLIDVILPVAAESLGGGDGVSRVGQAFDDVDYVVSGSYLSPYFLTDDDGDQLAGADATLKTNTADDDDTFDIDIPDGQARVRPGEVTFICTVPEATAEHQPPFKTIIYSHAISSTRLEMLVFAGQMAKFGLATCTIDAAGHGVDVPDEFEDLIDDIAANLGLPGLPAVLAHDRARDIDNDGAVESGEDYFTSALLHSRDMIRQTTVDQMQLVRILRGFDGQARFGAEVDAEDPWIAARADVVASFDHDGDGQPELRGDFNGDGTIDFGGEQTYLAWGTSLGGLQTGVLAGIEPTIVAAASNAGGGGLADIAVRTDIKNVRHGVFLPMFGPLLIGNAVGEAKMQLDWVLPSGIDRVRVPFATIDGVADGDRVVLRNLAHEAKAHVPDAEKASVAHVRDGRFRVTIAADGASPMTRRARLGFDPSVDVGEDLMGCHTGGECGEQECNDSQFCAADQTCKPVIDCITGFDPADLDAEGRQRLEQRTVSDPTVFGDPLVIEIYGADGQLKHTIDTFPQHFVYHNILYPKGAPLAAFIDGYGLKRQTPRFRKFMSIGSMLLEPADPAVYASRYFRDPIAYPYEKSAYRNPATDMLVVGTLGDQTVPINTAMSLARVAGIVDTTQVDARYGTTENAFLIDNWAYEGIWWLGRIDSHPDAIFDPDDLDRGLFGPLPGPNDLNLDADKPLRATVRTDSGISALRLPYLSTRGEHTFNVPVTGQGFDVPTFMANQVGWYLYNEGDALTDDPCLEHIFMEECDFWQRSTPDEPAN